MNKRQKAILKRNIFLALCAVIVLALVTLIVYIVSAVSGNKETVSSQSSQSEPSSSIVSSENSESIISSSSSVISSGESESSSEITSSEETPDGLDASYSNLTLVNGWNLLPEDYDYEGNLTTIPQKYIKGSLKEIDKDIWPYLKAMLDDARDDGIDIGVWSPYRSYATQKMLFERQVKKQIANGVPESEAEDKAAMVVARPGTSEHNTGLALDINCANSSFEKTKAYKWLTKNAENYGFIMRYRKDKQEKTGVIHESWHWRFVGINAAKEINQLDMCLEEYVEYKK